MNTSPAPTSSSVIDVTRRTPGEFRLVHYCVLVALAILLGMTIVWQQISTVRLGYRIEETTRQCERLSSHRDALRSEIDARVNPLALEHMVRGLQLPLDRGAAPLPVRTHD